eukprot:TRINITY_DN1224_c0_g2_i1.p1 TRINITY_DN1224_c0_g2~~TRINITY_DN1224_c0_g2_i1.p1  ORF type:complete len:244 (-),score=30.92 TRINITY_DN1224_c0_g2_i1:222-953(-)
MAVFKLKAVVLVSYLVALCYAQEDLGLFYNHPLTNMPPKLPGVTVKSVLPEHSTKLFPAGDVIDVLVGVLNESPDVVNVTSAMGSINSPSNFTIHVQNFSMMAYNMIVNPMQTISLLYHIRTDPNLYPRDWQFAFTLFYHSKGERYSDTFFNETIVVVEPDRVIDVEMLFMYVILLGIVGVGGFFGYQAVKNIPMVKKYTGVQKSTKKVEGGAENKEQWLEGTPAAKDYKKRASKKVSSTKQS